MSQAKGLGYAINTPEELKFVKEIASVTGVVLDPVYRYNILQTFIFLHTGDYYRRFLN